MSLIKRAGIVFGTGLIVFIIALGIGTHLLILNKFKNMEEERTLRNVNAVLMALNKQEGALASSLLDYAHWDDTYEFVQGEYDAYIDENLGNSVFTTFAFDLIAFTNASDEPFFLKGVNEETGEDIYCLSGRTGFSGFTG